MNNIVLDIPHDLANIVGGAIGGLFSFFYSF